MRSRGWVWVFVASTMVAAAGIVLLSVYRRDVAEAGIRFLADRARAQSAAEVGRSLPAAFQVRLHGSGSRVALRTLLADHGGVVMLYSSECSACAEALDHYVHRYGTGRRQAGMPFFALSFDEQTLPPGRFPAARFLHAAGPLSGTLFDIMVRPTFWVFNRSGIVQFREVGFYKDTMDLMLDTPLKGTVSMPSGDKAPT